MSARRKPAKTTPEQLIKDFHLGLFALLETLDQLYDDAGTKTRQSLDVATHHLLNASYHLNAAARHEASRPMAARDVAPGTSWAFVEHRSQAEV
jgi:hypothetical protein